MVKCSSLMMVMLLFADKSGTSSAGKS